MSEKKNVNGSDRPEYPKADIIHRAVARFADFVIAGVLVALLPGILGIVTATGYLLIADGLLRGQSLGKRLAGIKVVNRRNRSDAGFRESIGRNLPFAVVVVFLVFPLFGWILFGLGSVFVIGFEFYMSWTDRLGLRIGDVLVETQVVDASVPVDSSTLSTVKVAETPEGA